MADIIEIELIKKYNTTNQNCGYNLSRGGAGTRMSKEVYQYSLDGTFIKRWDSLIDASEELNILSAGISACCTGKSNYCGKWYWSYKKLDDKDIPIIPRRNCIKVKQYTVNGEYIRTYESIKAASLDAQISIGNISASCHKRGGMVTNDKYRWTYTSSTIKNVERIIKMNKKINQFSISGEYIKTWNSAMEIENSLGFGHSKIASNCRLRQKSAYNYIWQYESLGKELDLNEYNIKYFRLKSLKDKKDYITNARKINQYDLNNELLMKWDSITIAAKKLKLNNITGIIKCCSGKTKTSGGYIWRYCDDEN